MKKKFILKTIIVMSFVLLSSCTHPIDSTKETEVPTVEKIAQDYVMYKSVWTNFESGRNAVSSENKIVYPEFLYHMDLFDENGNPIKFADFSEEQKSEFYKTWQQEDIKYCISVLTDNEELQQAVLADNKAMEEAIKAANRSAMVNKSYMLFLTTYLNTRKKLVKENEQKNRTDRASSSASSDGETLEAITKECLNQNSVNALKSVYKKGLVLYTPDAASSSTSYFGGHTGITKKEEWSKEWDEDGLAEISISAWGNSKPNWNGKKDGVQYEPLGFWAGNSESSANYVKVLQMRRPQVVVKFAWIIPYLTIEYQDAPSFHADVAVQFAEDQKGKPYDIGEDIFTTIIAGSGMPKWKTDNFYCSQLVWRSWVHASLGYDFVGLRPLVLPADFEMAMNTRTIIEYRNK